MAFQKIPRRSQGHVKGVPGDFKEYQEVSEALQGIIGDQQGDSCAFLGSQGVPGMIQRKSGSSEGRISGSQGCFREYQGVPRDLRDVQGGQGCLKAFQGVSEAIQGFFRSILRSPRRLQRIL